jgi:hypothetical protein
MNFANRETGNLGLDEPHEQGNLHSSVVVAGASSWWWPWRRQCTYSPIFSSCNTTTALRLPAQGLTVTTIKTNPSTRFEGERTGWEGRPH